MARLEEEADETTSKEDEEEAEGEETEDDEEDDYASDPLNRILTICGADTPYVQKLIRDMRLDSLYAFSRIGETYLESVITTVNRYKDKDDPSPLPLIGPFVAANLQALAYWCREQRKKGITYPDPTLFDEDTRASALEEMETLEQYKTLKDPEPTLKPEDFKPQKWKQWVNAANVYFRSLRGQGDVPLSYVFRKEPGPKTFPTTDEGMAMQKAYSIRHSGNAFAKDNARVFNALDKMLVNTDAHHYIKKFQASQNGKGAWHNLVAHYEGDGLLHNRVGHANAVIESLVYHSERRLPFEKFISKLIEAFQTLEEHDQGYNETKKVSIMLKAIHSENSRVQGGVSTVQILKPNNFEEAVNYLSSIIGLLNSDGPNTTHNGKPAARNVSAIGGRGGGRGGRGAGRGRGRGGNNGRGGGAGGGGPSSTVYSQNGRKVNNGVDITDLTRTFTSIEWKKLHSTVRAQIQAARRAGDQGGNNRNVSSTNSHQLENPDAHHHPNTPSSGNGNGSGFGSEAYNNNSGNKRQRTNTNIGEVKSGTRALAAVHRESRPAFETFLENGSPGTIGAMEFDSHADTCCFGANFTILHATNYCCDVTPFLNSYQAIKNVPVVSAATAYDDHETGETIILEFHQGLWFGQQMSHSLINPNQCRHFGIQICDDPFDPHRPLGIHDPVTAIFAPLQYAGNIVKMPTRAPSHAELTDTSIRRVTMTSQAPWDPSTVGARPMSKEEEMRARLISTATSDSTRVTSSAGCDTHLASCSAAYVDRIMLPMLISAIKVVSLYADTPEDGRDLDTVVSASAISLHERHSRVTAEEIARKFYCGLQTAQNTLKATTQRGIRHAVHPLSRRYRTDIMQSRLKRLKGNWYADTMFSNSRSLKGNTCAHVFTNGKFIHLEPITSKSEVGLALQSFGQDVGVPETLIFDGALEQCGPKTQFMKFIRNHDIHWRIIEPHSHWQNQAEGMIREVRKKWRAMQQRRKIPMRLWDYALVHLTRLSNLTAKGSNKRTAWEEVTGDTPDISEYLDFEFYDWVWYWDTPGDMDNPKIGKWLGVAHRIGAAMCFYVLTQDGKVLARSTVQHLTKAEALTDATSQRLREFELEINGRLDDRDYTMDHQMENAFYIEDIGDITDEELSMVAAGMGISDIPDPDEYSTPDAYDEYIGKLVLFPHPDGNRVQGRVTKRLRWEDGTPVGRRHQNPKMDTRQYEVEMLDGAVEAYHANVIAENMFAQVDSEGIPLELLDEITDHRKDSNAIDPIDGWITTSSNNKVRKKTTKGWKLLVSWKGGSSDWVDLKDLKEAHPIELAEYAIANRLDEEPAFAWWVADALRSRNRIVSKVKSRYWKTSHKFGIELPHSVEQAYDLDRRNGDDLWRRAIEKEMGKIKGLGAFERYDKASPHDLRSNKTKLPGYQEIKCHMIFDIKMDGDFTRKARFVANGAMTHDVPAHITYASVVSRESVRIALLYASLNRLSILGCDVTNAYLNAPCKEKIWIEGGPEFGSEQGSTFIIRKALYGLKSSGFSWRTTMCQTVETMGYKSTIADPDVYIRESAKTTGELYYEFLLVYVDDILCVSENPKLTLDAITKVFEVRGAVKEPDRYLGANLKRWGLPDGRTVWAMDGIDYVRSSVGIVKDLLHIDGQVLKAGKAAERPMSKSYRPELDTTPELNPQLASRYQQLIGILRWAVELGRVDIMLEVALLSSFLANPREGHLDAVYNIFAYLEKHSSAPMAFDDLIPNLNPGAFQHTDWTDSPYKNAQEELPPKMPKPLGEPVVMSCFVDANHAGDQITRRSQTGFIIFLNNAPISWYSKKQNTVESSTFGSEFVAMRIAIEHIRALRYKLRMFGIPIDGPTNVFGDNESVVNSASRVEARLNKKHNAICFHTVREAAAAGWIRVGWEPTATNIADLFTKMLDTMQRRRLLRMIFIKGGSTADEGRAATVIGPNENPQE